MSNRILAVNLHGRNVSNKVIDIVKRTDTADSTKKPISLKVTFNGLSTGATVWVSQHFFYSDYLKNKVINEVENSLNREVSFGTRHIYIGKKLC